MTIYYISFHNLYRHSDVIKQIWEECLYKEIPYICKIQNILDGSLDRTVVIKINVLCGKVRHFFAVEFAVKQGLHIAADDFL